MRWRIFVSRIGKKEKKVQTTQVLSVFFVKLTSFLHQNNGYRHVSTTRDQ
jgi:hypothetical protein